MATKRKKDIVKKTGRVTKVETSSKKMPKHQDLNKLPKYEQLIKGSNEPKKLIGRGYSDIERTVKKYFTDNDTKALREFLQNFMYFPRDLVKLAQKYYDQLVSEKDSAGDKHTEENLNAKDAQELMSIGNKMGLFFTGNRSKEDMIKAILNMQNINKKRATV